ncbi:MAG: FGGY family carbohydrate kinase [Sphaerochaetaceae bacterium]
MLSLALDIGTTKICLLIYDCISMKVLNLVSVLNSSSLDTSDTQKFEQDPQIIWKLIQQLFAEIRNKSQSYSEIQNICITGQMHGILIIDEKGAPLTNLITWRDCRPLKDSLCSFPQQNGCMLNPGYGGYSLVALKQVGFDFSNKKVCTISSFIRGRMCGDYCIDQSFAASLGLFDVRKKQWNEDQITKLNLPLTLFSPTLESCIDSCQISAVFAKEVGLADSVQVYAPLGDNQASYLGSVGFQKLGLINLGTGGQLTIPCKDFFYYEGFEIRPFPDNSFLQVYSSLCGGWAYAYLKDFCRDVLHCFGFEVPESKVYHVLDSLAEKETGLDELWVDTRFLGERGKVSEGLFGSINHITTTNLTLKSLAYGFLKGMVKELYHPIFQQIDHSCIYASGNAVRKSSLVQALIEKEFSCTCKLPPFSEEAAVGVALGVGVWGSGIITEQQVNQFFKTTS